MTANSKIRQGRLNYLRSAFRNSLFRLVYLKLFVHVVERFQILLLFNECRQLILQIKTFRRQIFDHFLCPQRGIDLFFEGTLGHLTKI